MYASAMTASSDALRPLSITLSTIDPGLRHGLADPLLISDPTGWTPATALVQGTKLPSLIAAAQARWRAPAHTAAALAWKSYSYWLAMPMVLSWAAARRVPLLEPQNVLVKISSRAPTVQVGLRQVQLAVLPDDPLAQLSGHTTPGDTVGITVAADEDVLLKTIRMTLLERHLDPLSVHMRQAVQLGRRTLLGSVASGIAYAVLRAGRALPGAPAENVRTLLTALDLADLIDLAEDPDGTLNVRRRTCCLAFTLPQPKICSGCCLR